MAEPVRRPLSRRLARIGRALVAWPALILGLYFLAGWAGSSIPRNPGWSEAPGGVEIMVESNGVHTSIVMPLVTSQKDWRTDFPAAELGAPDRPYTHVSIGWGEREVYLNTPTWFDLSPRTVLRIIVAGGDGMLHVARYLRPAPDPSTRPLRISEDEYTRLVAWIARYVRPPGAHEAHAGYFDNDAFYDAPGRYTPLYTSNQWTSDALAAAGIRTGWWTPFAGGVMKWVPKLGA